MQTRNRTTALRCFGGEAVRSRAPSYMLVMGVGIVFGLASLAKVMGVQPASAAQGGFGVTPLDFFVSPRGNDAWSGRLRDPGLTDGPFATLEQARAAIRALRRRQGTPMSVRVTLRGGTYFLDRPVEFGPMDSGAEKTPVVYAAASGEKVVLSGGRRLGGGRWGEVNQRKAWVVDIAEVKAGTWRFRQLFALGRSAQVDRGGTGGFELSCHRNLFYFQEDRAIGTYGIDNSSTNVCAFDHNLYWSASSKPVWFGTKSLAEWQALGQDRNSVIADPLFVNSAAGDFGLRPDSPARQIGFAPWDMSNVGPRSTLAVPAPSPTHPWQRWEHALTSTHRYANPCSDTTVRVAYTGPGGRTLRTCGFWDGGDTFRIRCAFPVAGAWQWETECSDTANSGLHRQRGTVNVVPDERANTLYRHEPHKPVVNLEAMYDAQGQKDWRAVDARSLAWRSWLSGAMGYTYGAGDLPPKVPTGGGGIWKWVTDPSKYDYWEKALQWESAFQMRYLHDFLSSLEWWRLEPSHDLIRNQPEEVTRRMVLARTGAGNLAVAYLPDNDAIEIDLSVFPAPLGARWFDPVHNRYIAGAGVIENKGVHRFTPPSKSDWVLLLERRP